jgi:hypothetical protein
LRVSNACEGIFCKAGASGGFTQFPRLSSDHGSLEKSQSKQIFCAQCDQLPDFIERIDLHACDSETLIAANPGPETGSSDLKGFFLSAYLVEWDDGKLLSEPFLRAEESESEL